MLILEDPALSELRTHCSKCNTETKCNDANMEVYYDEKGNLKDYNYKFLYKCSKCGHKWKEKWRL